MICVERLPSSEAVGSSASRTEDCWPERERSRYAVARRLKAAAENSSGDAPHQGFRAARERGRSGASPRIIDFKRQFHIVECIEKRDQIGLLKHEADVVAAKIAQGVQFSIGMGDHLFAINDAPSAWRLRTPAIINIVVLPDPLGPMMPVNVPGFNTSEVSASATTSDPQRGRPC
jgi:hypothetical protein